MEGSRFGQIAATLSAGGTRRGVLGFLSTLPLLGGLAALLGDDETDAAGRRKRRKKRHKHGKGRHQGKRKKTTCTPNSTAKTCAGTCGVVKNNCQKTVDCGSCECESACAVCQICDAATGECVPEQQGEACGQFGQVCQDGACACDDASCGACQTCQVDGLCASPCDGSGCCDGAENCQPGTANDACGTDGDICLACSNPTPLCVDGACTALAGIDLTKSSDATDIVLGSVITYTFLVENTGHIVLEDVVVIDPLPGLSAITCPGTNLAAGASFACFATYVVTQADVDAGEIRNTATATGAAPGNVVVIDEDSLVVPPN